MKESEIFNVTLSIHGFGELKSHIHASSSRHSRVCIKDKRIHMITEDLEQRFRGSISLTTDDCTDSGYIHDYDDIILGFL